MDISTYTAHGLNRLHNDPDKRADFAAKGTQIRAVDPAALKAASTPEQSGSQTVSESGVFETVLDTVNPLQHLPGVSTAYQSITGDESSALANMAGGFLFGGPVGLMAGAAKSFLEMVTGKSLADHATAFFGGEADQPQTPDGVQLADTVQRDPLLGGQATAGMSVQQYQAFAEAAQSRHQGIGAQATEVSWADTIWTQRALKQATGLYENNQHLGGQSDKRNRLI